MSIKKISLYDDEGLGLTQEGDKIAKQFNELITDFIASNLESGCRAVELRSMMTDTIDFEITYRAVEQRMLAKIGSTEKQ